MAQKHSYAGRSTTACLVCDDPEPTFEWSDLHGEGCCSRCGTPYMLLRDGRRLPQPECCMVPEIIPVLREYWEHTHERNALGTYIVASDYPEELPRREAFDRWMDEHHPELVAAEGA